MLKVRSMKLNVYSFIFHSGVGINIETTSHKLSW